MASLPCRCRDCLWELAVQLYVPERTTFTWQNWSSAKSEDDHRLMQCGMCSRWSVLHKYHVGGGAGWYHKAMWYQGGQKKKTHTCRKCAGW